MRILEPVAGEIVEITSNYIDGLSYLVRVDEDGSERRYWFRDVMPTLA